MVTHCVYEDRSCQQGCADPVLLRDSAYVRLGISIECRMQVLVGDEDDEESRNGEHVQRTGSILWTLQVCVRFGARCRVMLATPKGKAHLTRGWE